MKKALFWYLRCVDVTIRGLGILLIWSIVSYVVSMTVASLPDGFLRSLLGSDWLLLLWIPIVPVLVWVSVKMMGLSILPMFPGKMVKGLYEKKVDEDGSRVAEPEPLTRST